MLKADVGIKKDRLIEGNNLIAIEEFMKILPKMRRKI